MYFNFSQALIFVLVVIIIVLVVVNIITYKHWRENPSETLRNLRKLLEQIGDTFSVPVPATYGQGMQVLLEQKTRLAIPQAELTELYKEIGALICVPAPPGFSEAKSLLIATRGVFEGAHDTFYSISESFRRAHERVANAGSEPTKSIVQVINPLIESYRNNVANLTTAWNRNKILEAQNAEFGNENSRLTGLVNDYRRTDKAVAEANNTKKTHQAHTSEEAPKPKDDENKTSSSTAEGDKASTADPKGKAKSGAKGNNNPPAAGATT